MNDVQRERRPTMTIKSASHRRGNIRRSIHRIPWTQQTPRPAKGKKSSTSLLPASQDKDDRSTCPCTYDPIPLSLSRAGLFTQDTKESIDLQCTLHSRFLRLFLRPTHLFR